MYNLAALFSKQWRISHNETELPSRIFVLDERSNVFEEYYDKIQEYLQSLSGMDEFLSGEFVCCIIYYFRNA